MGKTDLKGAGKPPRVPAYCLHKPTRQAFVRVAGKFVYLGAYGSENCDQQPKSAAPGGPLPVGPIGSPRYRPLSPVVAVPDVVFHLEGQQFVGSLVAESPA